MTTTKEKLDEMQRTIRQMDQRRREPVLVERSTSLTPERVRVVMTDSPIKRAEQAVAQVQQQLEQQRHEFAERVGQAASEGQRLRNELERWRCEAEESRRGDSTQMVAANAQRIEAIEQMRKLREQHDQEELRWHTERRRMLEDVEALRKQVQLLSEETVDQSELDRARRQVAEMTDEMEIQQQQNVNLIKKIHRLERDLRTSTLQMESLRSAIQIRDEAIEGLQLEIDMMNEKLRLQHEEQQDIERLYVLRRLQQLRLLDDDG